MSDEYEGDEVVEEVSSEDTAVEEIVSEPVEESNDLDLSGVLEDVDTGDVTGSYDPEPQPEPEYNPFLDSVRGAGLQAESVEDAQSVLLQSYQNAQNHAQQQAYQQQMQQQAWQQQQMHQQQQMQQMQQMAQVGQQFAQLADNEEFRGWVDQQAEAQADDGKWWSPPQVDESELQKWRTPLQQGDGSWQWGWREDTPKDIISKANSFVDYHEQWAEDLTRRPHEVLPRIIEEEFDKLFIDRYGSLLDQAQQQQDVQSREQHIKSINERNADWVYQKDPTSGQYMRDHTGRLSLTPEGQQVIGYINQLRQGGMQDPDQLWQTSTQMLAGQMANTRLGEMQQQMAAQQSTQDRNVRHLQRGAGYIPNRGGSVAPPENPSPNSQNQHLSAGDKLRQQALSDGLF